MTAPRKQPQDHKLPKADGGVTVEFEGEVYELEPEALDDVEVFNLIMSAEEDPRAGVAAVRRVVGEEAWGRMVESIRTESGRVPLSKTMEFIKAVMGPLGNSVGSLIS